MVNVVISEFFDDFVVYEFCEQIVYMSNVVGFEIIFIGYSVCGVDVNVQFCNGFCCIGLIDKVNVDCVEVIKGVVVFIYGIVMLGGIVNIIIKCFGIKLQYCINVFGGFNVFICV